MYFGHFKYIKDFALVLDKTKSEEKPYFPVSFAQVLTERLA